MSPGPTSAPPATKTTRGVEETDLYRFDPVSNRLYYLNSYRGLMVFDVTNVDQPKLLGRSPIFGSPVDMVVKNNIAVVVVGDWYGTTGGSPFHGSIVRGLDATDPTNIKVTGEAQLGGWVQEDRVVTNADGTFNLYVVSQEEGWFYDWGYGGGVVGISNGGGGVSVASPAGGYRSGSGVIVTSVSVAGGTIHQVSQKTYSGYGGVFNVTPNSILLAHADIPATDGGYVTPTQTDLAYLDITDPGGAITERGTLKVDGTVNTNGADNGRWTLDFADGVTAHLIANAPYNGAGTSTGQSYILSIADFSNPDSPKLDSSLPIPSPGWSATARFDSGRMYLCPDSTYYYGGTTAQPTTPLEIYDLSNPASPVRAGSVPMPGTVWLMIPSGDGKNLFALGSAPTQTMSQIALTYLDVTSAVSPLVIGTSAFGEGWTSTPASGTFKAFVTDPTNSFVVLPFSGWDSTAGKYNNGVQLVEFTPTSITTAGAGHTKGWVERGIFVKNRLLSLSDLALGVFDYTNPQTPQKTNEITLARSVISAQPSSGSATIAEISSDFWDNDVSTSDVRVLPLADAEENTDESAAPGVSINGIDAQVFTNGNFDYVLTSVEVPVTCSGTSRSPSGGVVTSPGKPGGSTGCTAWQQQVQVVDLSNGGAKLRGKLSLPLEPNGYYQSWGWFGCYPGDWYDGASVVQVGGDALAFRRWAPSAVTNAPWNDGSSDLFVVDLSNPDAPALGQSVITSDPTGWWGDMKVVGDTLYTSHYEWVPEAHSSQSPTARYYLDRIDLSDRKNPKIEKSINVPGVLVGGSAANPSVLYTIDSNWDGSTTRNWFDVVQVDGDRAYLQSKTELDGYTGKTVIVGTTAYLSTQVYSDRVKSGQPAMELHQIDLSNPKHPVDRVASGKNGWGWLLDVQGDRAMVTSGWGSDGLDIYRLSPTAAPVYDQFVRTRGYSVRSLSRQGNALYLSSGYWGVQAVALK
jgi:hypothetical protein